MTYDENDEDDMIQLVNESIKDTHEEDTHEIGVKLYKSFTWRNSTRVNYHILLQRSRMIKQKHHINLLNMDVEEAAYVADCRTLQKNGEYQEFLNNNPVRQKKSYSSFSQKSGRSPLQRIGKN